MRLAVVFLPLVLAVPPASFSRQESTLCGSHRDRLQEEIVLHRRSVERRAARARALGLDATAPSPAREASRDVGDLVLLDSSGGVVSERNDFDLDRRTLHFIASAAEASRYRFAADSGSYDTAAAAAGALIEDFGDDDSQEVRLPFSFPFYGRRYSSLFVNSDGNLTFEAPDVSSSDRSLGRATSGPPRIAPLFRDLDPTRAAGGVRVLLTPASAVVSWVGVPEYSDFGRGPLQTFQVRLSPDGRIEFAYEGASTRTAVAGIAPGYLRGPTSVVSFSDGSGEEFAGAVLESFTLVRDVDIVLAAQRFYERHDDAYDYLVFFNNLGLPAAPGAVAYEVTLRNGREGYGDFQVDIGREFGSPNRLQAIMNMGPVSQYPVNPNGVLLARSPARDTPLTVLGHEAGHLFLAFASVRDPADPGARPMLGRDNAHWSFVFNSEASFLEGNRICDRVRTPGACPADPSPTSRFVTTKTVEGYSPLDQYLMGFRPAEEVPDTFLVENPTILNVSRMPEPGVAFNGARRDVSIGEIVAAEGRRTPDHTVSQRLFRFAFVLVVDAASEPPAAVLEQVDRYRREFEETYRQATGGRAIAETALRRALRVSAHPAAGVLVGATTTVEVSIEEPAPAAIDVLLTASSGAAQVPASARIPAGGTSASFVATGAREGVDEISAEIPGGGYAKAVFKIQVLGGAAALRLTAVSGDGQVATPGRPLPEPVAVRIADINNLPYRGLRLGTRVTGGGSVEPAEAVSDEAGQVRFTWTPGPGAVNDLEIMLVGFPAGPRLVVSTTGQPQFASTGVVNAATFAPELSPGSLATIFGVNLAAGKTAAAALPLPFELAGVRVLVNGQLSRLLYAGDRQLNFEVPPGSASGPAVIEVLTPLGRSGAVQIALSPVSPGIFVVEPAIRLGAVAVAGTGLVTTARPAAPGEVVEIYATGLGAVEPDPVFPTLRRTVRTPEVRIAGQPAQVRFSGLAPGWSGLYQVNAQVPPGAPRGFQTMTLSIGGAAANEVRVVIQ